MWCAFLFCALSSYHHLNKYHVLKPYKREETLGFRAVHDVGVVVSRPRVHTHRKSLTTKAIDIDANEWKNGEKFNSKNHKQQQQLRQRHWHRQRQNSRKSNWHFLFAVFALVSHRYVCRCRLIFIVQMQAQVFYSHVNFCCWFVCSPYINVNECESSVWEFWIRKMCGVECIVYVRINVVNLILWKFWIWLRTATYVHIYYKICRLPYTFTSYTGSYV